MKWVLYETGKILLDIKTFRAWKGIVYQVSFGCGDDLDGLLLGIEQVGLDQILAIKVSKLENKSSLHMLTALLQLPFAAIRGRRGITPLLPVRITG